MSARAVPPLSPALHGHTEGCAPRGRVLPATVHPVHPVSPQPSPRTAVTPAPRGWDRDRTGPGRAGQSARPGAEGAPPRSPRSGLLGAVGSGAIAPLSPEGPGLARSPPGWLGAPGTVTAPAAVAQRGSRVPIPARGWLSLPGSDPSLPGCSAGTLRLLRSAAPERSRVTLGRSWRLPGWCRHTRPVQQPKRFLF